MKIIQKKDGYYCEYLLYGWKEHTEKLESIDPTHTPIIIDMKSVYLVDGIKNNALQNVTRSIKGISDLSLIHIDLEGKDEEWITEGDFIDDLEVCIRPLNENNQRYFKEAVDKDPESYWPSASTDLTHAAIGRTSIYVYINEEDFQEIEEMIRNNNLGFISIELAPNWRKASNFYWMYAFGKYRKQICWFSDEAHEWLDIYDIVWGSSVEKFPIHVDHSNPYRRDIKDIYEELESEENKALDNEENLFSTIKSIKENITYLKIITLLIFLAILLSFIF